MKFQTHRGTTSKAIKLFIQSNAVASGAGLIGLTSGSAGLIAYYIREGDNAATAITLGAGTLGTWSSGGFVEADATHLPGVYELGLPNAALSTGNSVVVMLSGATNMVPVLAEIQLTDTDVNDAVRFGLTALPNAAAGSTGGLDCTVTLGGTASAGTATTITLTGGSAVDNYYNHNVIQIAGGTGAGQTRIIIGYVGSTKVATVGQAWKTNPDNTSVFQVKGIQLMSPWNQLEGTLSAATGTTATLTGGVATNNYYNGALLLITAGTGAGQSRAITGYVGSTTVATVDRAWATNPDGTSVFLVLAGDLPGTDGSGNLSGSVASVAGAVASVTGNVGGNVVGSVASVTGNVGGNVVGSVASVTAAVTVGTNNDKTAYTLSAGGIAAVLATTLAELTQAQPPATPTVAQALMLVYHAFRNTRTVTATTDSITNDAGTVICKAAVSDDSVTFTRAKLVSGP